MPSLPVDNQSLNSQGDAYRRYFGRLKPSSPPKPRKLLCKTVTKICLWTLIASMPNIFLYYVWTYQQTTWYNNQNKYKLNNIYPPYKSVITYVLCLAFIHVIYQHKYANKWVMRFNAFIISFISFVTSFLMQHYCYTNWHQSWNIEEFEIFTPCLEDEIYVYALHFPLTLYFSIFCMYCAEYGECCWRLFKICSYGKSHDQT